MFAVLTVTNVSNYAAVDPVGGLNSKIMGNMVDAEPCLRFFMLAADHVSGLNSIKDKELCLLLALFMVLTV